MEGSDVKEMGDALRLEVAGPPARESRLRETMNNYVNIMERDFGKFIPDKVKQEARIAAYNTMIADDLKDIEKKFGDQPNAYQAFDEINKIIVDKDLTDIIDRGFLLGEHFTGNGVLVNVLQNSETLWARTSNDQKAKFETAMREKGILVSPENYLAAIIFIRTSGHELGHAYIRHDLPLPTEEFFAESIGDYLAEKGFNISRSSSKSSQLFNEMVAKYGDNVYRLMFGTLKNPLARIRILRDLNTDRVKAALPGRTDLK